MPDYSNMNRKIKVGILGCTGAVGQKFISLLKDHPYFEISDIAASESSKGKIYSEHVNWKEAEAIPEDVAGMKIKSCNIEDLSSRILFSRILFSGLDSKVAGEIEEKMARAGFIVISNSRNHRMNEDVPLVIPEINSSHFDLIKKQKTRWDSDGFIVTNPNCSVIVLALALYPIHKKFGLKNVIVTTMQAISGAGYPGVSSMDILGNIIPHIPGEEEKIETEPLKIFGEFEQDKIKFADLKISAMCNRVPVYNGHTLAISFETEVKANKDEIIKSWNELKSFDTPFSPQKVIHYLENEFRPQPLLDLITENGMAVTTGNLRKCNILDWKFTALGHNTIRGAAGAAILNAEYLVKNNFI
jgi:aspartate-semialdehyde dehydrogenase